MENEVLNAFTKHQCSALVWETKMQTRKKRTVFHWGIKCNKIACIGWLIFFYSPRSGGVLTNHNAIQQSMKITHEGQSNFSGGQYHPRPPLDTPLLHTAFVKGMEPFLRPAHITSTEIPHINKKKKKSIWKEHRVWLGHILYNYGH